MNWRCVWLPWHRIVFLRMVSDASDYFRCSCGREYGVNHDVRVVLPWAQVRSFYDPLQWRRTPYDQPPPS